MNKNRLYQPNGQPPGMVRQRGMVLIVALILLIPITYVAATLANRVSIEEIMSGNQRDGMQSLFIADTGIESALTAIELQVSVSDYSIDPLLVYAASHSGALLDDVGGSPLTNVNFGGGAFSVTIRDNDDGDSDPLVDIDSTVILASEATMAAGYRQVEILVGINAGSTGVSDYGILTEESIAIPGNLHYEGVGASIHSNTIIDVSGNPHVEQVVSAVGSISISGSPIFGSTEPLSPVIPVPHVVPLDFKPYANYIFTCHCKVIDVATSTQIADAESNPWFGWSCADEDKWTLSSDETGSTGFIYIEGNAVISGNPAENTSLPMPITLIVDGYLEVSGNPYYTSYGDPDHDPAIQDLLFAAGGDIKLNGNSANLFHGVIGAHQEISVSGNPNFEGSFVANNHNYQSPNPDNCQLEKNLVDDNLFSGNPHMINNVVSVWNPVAVPVKLTKLAWRELIN